MKLYFAGIYSFKFASENNLTFFRFNVGLKIEEGTFVNRYTHTDHRSLYYIGGICDTDKHIFSNANPLILYGLSRTTTTYYLSKVRR